MTKKTNIFNIVFEILNLIFNTDTEKPQLENNKLIRCVVTANDGGVRRYQIEFDEDTFFVIALDRAFIFGEHCLICDRLSRASLSNAAAILEKEFKIHFPTAEKFELLYSVFPYK